MSGKSVADPGFPVGGERGPVMRGVDPQCGCFSAKMYAKTKELGPVGRVCTWHAPLDLPMEIYDGGGTLTKD